MIRQRRNRAYLQKSSFKIQNQLFVQGNLIKPAENQQNQVFEQGIFNKFFKISINNKTPLSYASRHRNSSSAMNNKSNLCIKGENASFTGFNKENDVSREMTKSQSQSKMFLLQTTGNSMLSLKKYKRNRSKTTEKRPVSAVSTCRSSIQRQFMDGSISRILQELNQNSDNKRAQQKISTSQALVLYSKVLRNQQNSSSREFYKRKVKGSCERQKSLSLMTNKVKIQSKESIQSKRKLDLREYLQKVKLAGAKGSLNEGKKKRKQEDFDLGGWQTNKDGEFF